MLLENFLTFSTILIVSIEYFLSYIWHGSGLKSKLSGTFICFFCFVSGFFCWWWRVVFGVFFIQEDDKAELCFFFCLGFFIQEDDKAVLCFFSSAIQVPKYRHLVSFQISEGVQDIWRGQANTIQDLGHTWKMTVNTFVQAMESPAC